MKRIDRPGGKVLSSIILILLLLPFQLGGAVLAEGLQVAPSLVTSQDKPAQALIASLQAAGHPSRLMDGVQFPADVTAKNTHYILAPLSVSLPESTLAALSQYVADGGKLILLPVEASSLTEPIEARLLSIIGMSTFGFKVASQEMPLYWKGKTLPEQDMLPAGSRILDLTPQSNMTVLASWNQDYPAIASTDKGMVLNWPWKKQWVSNVSPDLLSKALPMISSTQTAKLDTPAVPSVNAEAPAMPPATLGVAASKTQEPEVQSEPATEKSSVTQPAVSQDVAKPVAIEQASSPPAPSPVMVVKQAPAPSGTSAVTPAAPEKNTEATSTSAKQEPVASANSVVPAVTPTGTMAQSATAAETIANLSNKPEKTAEATSAPAKSEAGKPEAVNEQAKTKPEPVASAASVAPGGTPSVTTAQPATPAESAAKPDGPEKGKTLKADAAEDEVLNNILGIPANQQAAPAAPGTPGTVAQPNPEQKQKHFSFLDPEAQSVLAPSLDYGLYSLNMRTLEDYKKQILDALSTSRQLALNLPEARVMSVLQESEQHKKKFETMYLGGQTQQGLDELAVARRLTFQALALTTTSPRVEGRAIWLDRATIIKAGNPEGVRVLMAQLHRAGINIVYFETVNAGFPLYQSAILKPNPMVQGWDPLKAAVDEGHRLGMEVHAWVWAFAVGNRRHNQLIGKPDDYAGPILEDAGLMGEALRNREGGLSVDNRQHEFWLSPASLKGREFLLNVYKEIVTNYDVDGLHLDYIRYPFQAGSARMGFEPAGREAFKKSTGLDLDMADDNTLRLWIAWKTYQVSSFVQQTSEMARRIRPQIKISAAVFPMKRESRIVAIQQDWETWVDSGWVDTLNPMSYTTDPERLQQIFQYVQSSPQKHTLFYPGIAINRLDGGSLVRQLEVLRQKGGLGSTLFAGAYLDGEKIETLGTGPYKATDSLPPHRDVVKSLQLILGDYEEKFTKLESEGALVNLSPVDAGAIKAAIAQLNAVLSAIGPVKNPMEAPMPRIQQAQQLLKNLQLVSQNWTSKDRVEHPYRAQYFDNRTQVLEQLVGYLADRAVPPAAAMIFELQPANQVTSTGDGPIAMPAVAAPLPELPYPLQSLLKAAPEPAAAASAIISIPKSVPLAK